MFSYLYQYFRLYPIIYSITSRVYSIVSHFYSITNSFYTIIYSIIHAFPIIFAIDYSALD